VTYIPKPRAIVGTTTCHPRDDEIRDGARRVVTPAGAGISA